MKSTELLEILKKSPKGQNIQALIFAYGEDIEETINKLKEKGDLFSPKPDVIRAF